MPPNHTENISADRNPRGPRRKEYDARVRWITYRRYRREVASILLETVENIHKRIYNSESQTTKPHTIFLCIGYPP